MYMHFPNISITIDGSLVVVLTWTMIPARSEHNGIVEECVAVCIDGSPHEIARSVTLTVIASRCSYYYDIVCMHAPFQ